MVRPILLSACAREVIRVPGASFDGEGGLLGLAVSPAYARGLDPHGGRIAFGPDGLIYAGVGDAGNRPTPRTAPRATARSCASRPPAGRGDTQGGRFANPKVTWRTSEASPSGAAIVGSSLYVGALAGERLWRVPLRGTSVGRPRALLSGRYGRLRTVVRAPGGALWISTSNRDGRGTPRAGDDRIIRVRP